MADRTLQPPVPGVKVPAVRFHETASFAAVPSRVWTVLADWEGQALWMPDVAWMRLLGSEREQGARLQVRTRVFGFRAATDLVQVTTWEPPHRLRIAHLGMVVGTGEWRLEATGPGGSYTRFTWIEDLRMPPPVLGSLALRAYAPWQRAMLRRSIRNLGRLVEGAQRSDAT